MLSDQPVSEPTFLPVAESMTVRLQLPLTGAPASPARGDDGVKVPAYGARPAESAVVAVSLKPVPESTEPERLPCPASVTDAPLGAVRTSERFAVFR